VLCYHPQVAETRLLGVGFLKKEQSVGIKQWVREFVTNHDRQLVGRQRLITWDGLVGCNGWGDTFHIHTGTDVELTATARCPFRDPTCDQHTEIVYRGRDIEEAKRAAQVWADEHWPLPDEPMKKEQQQ
jgi:hypothetical protein